MNAAAEFRFSPRPNRAGEIDWMAWGEGAFARARAEDKPILLAISAVWCHWCHVMDETSYSDEDVIDAINRRFVAVRVDNDRRPDVNARYNMGGWPTTAFLAPDGSTLTGATYLPPAQMRRALIEIADFYAANKAQVAERASTARPHPAYRPAERADLSESAIAGLVEELAGGYDREYGGFGDAPKFPQPEMLDFLFAEWRFGGDERLRAMVVETMLAMSRGGTYDRVEGGFFRYSTTRDWSVPHFEKMAEDHAGLIRLLARLVSVSPAPALRETLVSSVRYVLATLYDGSTGFFAGSQDADEEYFALPLEERRARKAPYVDRTSYTNWTCALAGSLLFASRALDDDALQERALRTLDNVAERLTDANGLLYHVAAPGEAPAVRGLLTDQVAYLRALLDAHETAGEPRFLDRAVSMASQIVERFEAEDGGFYDRVALESTLGRLDLPDRPIGDNGILAESLLRLSALAGDERWRSHAERTLLLYARTYASAGSFAAPYARALRRFLAPEIVVRVVATPDAGADFREAAARLPSPFVNVRTLRPPQAESAGLPSSPAPAAYVCRGTVCGEPVTAAAALRTAYDAAG